jgi:membrane-associated phospholipid phosphatase/phosphoglycolate phosphatase-like HAD superfamily hydrolase
VTTDQAGAGPARAPASAPRLGGPARRRLGLVLAALLAGFALLTLLVGTHATRGLDRRTLQWIDAIHVPGALGVARWLEVAGVWWVMAPLVACVAIVLLVVLRRRHDAVYLVATVATAGALDILLKLLFGRLPPVTVTDISPWFLYAYPSGHTMSTTAVVSALAFIAWRTRWRVPVLVSAVVWATLMGLGRLELAAHWPTDVLAGWLLGVAVAIALRLILTRAGRTSRASAAAPAARAVPGSVEVVLVDWGGTLMTDDGSRQGPMAAWPEVSAVAGAYEALEKLQQRYRVIVATNADDSGGPAVLAALSRVGLDGLVDDVLSSRDLGTRKPDPFFFRSALLRAGRGGVPLPPEHAVMVGDSWVNDVDGARRAGLRTIWFNPARAPRPAGATPPDAEIARLADLVRAVAALDGRAAQPVANPGPAT